MAATSAGGRGGIGWAILAAALAVPGFLFYNWWSGLKAEHDRGVSAKARTRLPEGGMFQTPLPTAGRLVNPIAPAAAAPMPVSASAPAPVPVHAVAASAPVASPRVAAAAVPVAPARAAAPVVSPSPAAAAVSSATAVVLLRDPMLSPMDTVRLSEIEAEKIRAQQEIADEMRRRNRPNRPVRRKEIPIEDRIELQGIVANSEGQNLAIVNGATVKTGGSFAVDGYEGKIKVIKISTVSVVFEYKKRRFTVKAQ